MIGDIAPGGRPDDILCSIQSLGAEPDEPSARSLLSFLIGIGETRLCFQPPLENTLRQICTDGIGIAMVCFFQVSIPVLSLMNLKIGSQVFSLMTVFGPPYPEKFVDWLFISIVHTCGSHSVAGDDATADLVSTIVNTESVKGDVRHTTRQLSITAIEIPLTMVALPDVKTERWRKINV